MNGLVHMIVIAIKRELAVRGASPVALGNSFDVAFLLESVGDEVRDRADLDVMLPREALEIRPARHAAVFIQDLDNGGGRLETGETRKIATGFGVSRRVSVRPRAAP